MPLQSPYRRTQAIANRLAGMSQPEAMRKAGFSPHYANAEAYRFFSRPEIKSRMTQALEQAKPGVVELAAQAVTEALTAERAVVVFQGKDAASLVVQVPDHDLRLKAVDRLVDAFGFIPGKVEVPHAAPPPIIVTFSLHGQETSAVPGTKAVDMAPMMKPFVFKLKRAGLPNGSGNG